MESNEQMKLTSEIERCIDREQIDSYWGDGRGLGTEQKGKRLMDMDNSVVIAAGRGP